MNLKSMLRLVVLAALGLSLVADADESALLEKGYRLEQMVVLSRHNIRSPLSAEGSPLAELTPHKWFAWTSPAGELSLKGGQLETMMGQYFRQRLVAHGLITENHVPARGEMRFYANSMQRTIATAAYFSAGMLPVANARIEHKYAPSKMDPVFNPQLTFVSEAFVKRALSEIGAMGGRTGMKGLQAGLERNYRTLEKALDLRHSPAAKTSGLKRFGDDAVEVVFVRGREPAAKGSLRTATAASDALVLQFYEETDDRKAGFGRKLSARQWELVAGVKDAFIDILYAAPSVAVNIAHPLLKELRSELTASGRKFAFLCGHDSNLASVLAALGAKPYALPKAVEKRTPVGSKFVIETFAGPGGASFVKLSLVYQSVEQLRNRTPLTLENPPLNHRLELQGLEANADGLYALEDVLARFDEAIAAYGKLPGASPI